MKVATTINNEDDNNDNMCALCILQIMHNDMHVTVYT